MNINYTINGSPYGPALYGGGAKTDEEIKSLFHLPEHVVIRRKDGWLYSALCNVGGGRFAKTYYERY